MRLLVVEDSPLVRKMYGLAFPKRDHELTAAENGRTALIVIAESQQPYDLILLDLCMPNMDGMEFIRAVRSNRAFAQIPLTRVLEAEPGLQVVGDAASGAEAVGQIPQADPDVMTLDVAMPGMHGQQVLRALLRWKPTLKVVMLSAHTREGAEATIEALAAGDYRGVGRRGGGLYR